MRELPDGWRRIRLEDCGTWLSGGTPATEEPRFWGGDIPWISAASLKNFAITDSERKVTRLGSMSGTKLVGPGNVLFIVRGMSLKTEFRVGVTQRQVAFGQDCKAIIPSSSIDGTFLALALKACEREVLAMVDEAGHGTGRLPTDLLEKLSIGVPELAEQQQIVEVLNAIDDQRARLNIMSRKAMRVRRGIEEAVLGRTQPDSTLEAAFRGRPRNGLYVPSSYYGDVGTPIVRIDSIHNGEIRPMGRLLKVDIGAGDVDAFRLEESDIVINRVNSIEYVGKSALVGARAGVMVYESNIMRCKVRKDRYRAAYVAAWLSARIARGHFKSRAKSAVAQASINSADVLSCPIPEIPLEQQDEVVRSLTAARQAEVQVVDELTKLNLLKEGLVEDLLSGRVRV